MKRTHLIDEEPNAAARRLLIERSRLVAQPGLGAQTAPAVAELL